MFSISLLFISLFLPVITIIILLFSKGSFQQTSHNARVISFIASLVNLLMCVYFFIKIDSISSSYQFVTNYVFYDQLHLSFSIGLDNISLLFITITNMLFAIVFLFSDHKKFSHNFYIILLLLQFVILGTFLSINLFLFYVFFESSVFLVFFLMNKSHTNMYAQYKFLLFNVLGSLLMFVGIVFIVFINQDASMQSLFNSHFSNTQQNILWFGLFFAFAIKSGIFPFHIWVSDTYSNSENLINMILSGILIKFGIYGLLRIVLPALPIPSMNYAHLVSWLSLITAMFALTVAFTKDNIKSFIAYFSLGHVGIIVFGLFALTTQSIEGAIYQSFNHSIFIIGLILMFVFIERRVVVNNFSELRGVITKMPIFACLLMVVVLAGMSIPGTNTFIGEFLILQGAFSYSVKFDIVTTFSVVLSAAVILTMYKKLVYGVPTNNVSAMVDLKLIEILIALIIGIIIIVMGIFPQIFLDLIHPFTTKVVDIIKAKSIIINNVF
ncbi:NuoM family protein [Rickettsiales bacterium LUAb2]